MYYDKKWATQLIHPIDNCTQSARCCLLGRPGSCPAPPPPWPVYRRAGPHRVPLGNRLTGARPMSWTRPTERGMCAQSATPAADANRTGPAERTARTLRNVTSRCGITAPGCDRHRPGDGPNGFLSHSRPTDGTLQLNATRCDTSSLTAGDIGRCHGVAGAVRPITGHSRVVDYGTSVMRLRPKPLFHATLNPFCEETLGNR